MLIEKEFKSMKTFNKTLLLAAVLASAANANVQVTGDTTIGLKYTLKDRQDTTKEDKFSVQSGNSNQGLTHITFAAAEGGKGGQGAYLFMETLSDIDGDGSSLTFTMGQEFVGYRTSMFDIRMGQIDTLMYSWVGAKNEKMLYADNIAIEPVKDQDVSNMVRLTTRLGKTTVSADVQLQNDGDDYCAYDIGARLSLGKADLSLVHQEYGEGDSGFAGRNTTGASISYDITKALNVTGTYANYSEKHASNGEDDAYSLAVTYNNASVLYQTSPDKDQARYNLMYQFPVSKHTTFGVEAQFGNDFHHNGSTKTKDDEFVVGYINYVL
jgi:hypothetical protein